MRLSIIVLASGLSRRMGTLNKLFLPYQGTTFLSRTLTLIDQIPCFERILVISPEDLAKAVVPRGFQIVANDQRQLGLGHSVVLGTQQASGDAYLFVPIDQPYLTADALETLIAQASKDKIVYPRVKGLPTNPMIFGSLFRVDLLQLHEDSGGRNIRKAHPEAAIGIDMPAFIFTDVDTPELYQQLIEEGLHK